MVVEQTSPLPLPLRYRLADKVIAVLRYALGPAYMGVRTAAVKSAKLCLRLKSPGGFIPSSG